MTIVPEKKWTWRQPVLGDGNPVPLAAYGKMDEAKIELKVSCRNLLNGNVEDAKAFVVVYAAVHTPSTRADQQDTVKWEIGRTEVVYNSANPDFETTFLADFSTHLDKLHDIGVAVFSEQDVMDDDLNKQRRLGNATIRLEHVLRARGFSESCPLQSGGSVILFAYPSEKDCESLMFCYTGKGFKTRSKTPVIKAKRKPKNPYIVVSYKSNKDGKWKILWKSEVVQGSDVTNFGFGQFRLSKVNGGDVNSPVQLLAMNWDEKHQRYKTIGQVETNLGAMSTNTDGQDVINKGKCAGRLITEFVERVSIPSMANYVVKGGCSVDLTFAVDFTSNNGGPGNPDSRESLHCLDRQGQPNTYRIVLEDISTIFQEYMDETRFQLWGFGGILDGALDHQFLIGEDIGCVGVKGVCRAYTEAVRSGITMSGPKLLRPTLDAAIERAVRMSQSNLSYSVLIILCCDGIVTDASEVMEKISQASYVPLSIVFVGVGDGDFKSLQDMNFENAELVSPSGNEYMRDVARFVHLGNLKNDAEGWIHKLVQKVPEQLVQYHLSQGIFPPAVVVSAEHDDDQPGRAVSKPGSTDIEPEVESGAAKEGAIADRGKQLLASMDETLDSDEESEPEYFAHEVKRGSGTEIGKTTETEAARKSTSSTSDYGKHLLDSMHVLDDSEEESEPDEIAQDQKLMDEFSRSVEMNF